MISILNNEIKIIKKNISKKIENKKLLLISDILNIDNIVNELEQQNKVVHNDINISKKDSYYVINKNINKELIDVLKQNNILNSYLKYIEDSIALNIEESIKIGFIFYFILIDLFNLKYITKDELLYYLDISNNEINNLNRNYELCITNNLSNEINKDNYKSFIKGNNRKVKEEIISLYNDIGLLLIEVPFNCDLLELKKFLEDIKAYKVKFDINNMRFNLRFKKIKKYKKDGMYFVNANTIILDSRNITGFKHELGHFLYENNIPFLYNKEYINPLDVNLETMKFLDCKHKIEDYNLNSERFAYWFERN